MEFKRVFFKAQSFLFLLLCFTGCTRIYNDPYVISDNVAERIGKQVMWNRNCSPCVQEWIENQLQTPLSADLLVQIALLNNPKIQALYENIGIASADLLQASLVSNPLLEGYARVPNQKGLSLNTAFSVAFRFLDVLLVPLRKKAAQAELAKVELEVTHEVLAISFEVEKVYFRLLAETLRREKLKSIVELLEAEQEVAQEQLTAQSIYTLFYLEKSNQLVQARLEFNAAEMAIATHFQHLTALLGLCGCEWTIACSENEMLSLPCLDSLQCMALQRRFDYLALKWKVQEIVRLGRTKEWWTYTNLMLGLSTEREAEGFWETGPSFAVAIPLFDYGQAARARLKAEFFQTLQNLKNLKVEILAEIREVYAHAHLLKETLFSFQELLANQNKLVQDAQLLYNVMALGVYDLIQNKIESYRMEIDCIVTMRDYHISLVRLKETMGGL